MKSASYTVLFAAGLLAAGLACAQDKPVTIQMQQQNGSGESGTATLTPQGESTQVVLKLAGAPAEAQPAHIHPGTCAQLDPKPQYPLQSVTNGTSTSTVPVALAKILDGAHAINVHKSATDLKTYVSCGDLKK